LLLALLIFAADALAAPLRVTSWNFEAESATPEGLAPASAESRLQIAAQALHNLNPDVILLHNVPDWQTCGQLAQALRPADYSVLVCSSFRYGSNAPGHSQTAIISKRKAFMSWAEPWRAPLPGGYVFAAIQAGKQRIGFFALQISAAPQPDNNPVAIALSFQARAASVHQWTQAVDRCKDWVTNRIEGIVASGALTRSLIDRDSLQLLEAAGFSNPFLESLPPLAGPVPGHLDLNPDTPPGLILDHSPATCDLDFDPANSIVVSPAKTPVRGRLLPREITQLAPTSSVPASLPSQIPTAALLSQSRPVVPASSRQPAWWLAGTLVGVFALVTLTWIFSKRKYARATAKPAAFSLTMGNSRSLPSAYTIVVTPNSVTRPALNGPALPSTSPPPSRVEASSSLATRGESESWQPRALRAEHEAEHASALMRQGLIPHLSRWLKEKFVRRLIADRAQLLETQQAAALKTLALDQRLARVEVQIQQQNQAYERRIEDLNRELDAAKAENRELIQAQIIQVKAEMEAARARLLEQAKGDVDR